MPGYIDNLSIGTPGKSSAPGLIRSERESHSFFDRAVNFCDLRQGDGPSGFIFNYHPDITSGRQFDDGIAACKIARLDAFSCEVEQGYIELPGGCEFVLRARTLLDGDHEVLQILGSPIDKPSTFIIGLNPSIERDVEADSVYEFIGGSAVLKDAQFSAADGNVLRVDDGSANLLSGT